MSEYSMPSYFQTMPVIGKEVAHFSEENAGMFMDRIDRGEQHPPSVVLSATRLLYHMGNIFRDNAPASAVNGVQLDRKRLARLRQKRVALGHKPDDHEPEQQQGFSMKFHM